MNRRGILQLLSAMAASAAVPVPDFVLAESGVLIPDKPIILGSIRALTGNSIYTDEVIVRLEAYNGREQFGVDFVVPNGTDMRQRYLEARVFAEQVLRDTLIQEKWMATDMIALPIPAGYVEPEWMRA